MKRACIAAVLLVALVAALALFPMAGQARYRIVTVDLGRSPDGWYWVLRP